MREGQYLYNPGFDDDLEVIEKFVVRQSYLDDLLQTIGENTGPSSRHVLIVAPRGAGKTMLARRVVAEIRTQPVLNAKWHPVVCAEESYGITTAGEFWLECLLYLGEQGCDPRWQRRYEALRNEPNEVTLRERALGTLIEFIECTEKRLLLVVENFNMIFEQQMGDDAGWDLRHTLQNEPRIMVLATATSRFDEIDNINKALFEQFEVIRLRPLDKNECRRLWSSTTGEDVPATRVRPIQILNCSIA